MQLPPVDSGNAVHQKMGWMSPARPVQLMNQPHLVEQQINVPFFLLLD
jgi:hypothetical protein